MRRRLLILALVPTLVACGQPRIDGSSLEACDASIPAVARAAEDSVAFAMAFVGLAMRTAFSDFEAAMSSAFSFDDEAVSVRFQAPDSVSVQLTLCEMLHGLSASEIVAGADSLGLALARSVEVASAQAKIQPLRDARDAYRAAQDSLLRFEVVSARLEQSRGFIGLETVINLRVRNGTAHPVSRAYLRGRAITPGRSVPWLEEDFNYSIPGGLEPGEDASWRLQPNAFQGSWNSVVVPPDAVFQVEVTGLDGPGGEGLWGRPRFTRGDSLLLDSLSRRFER